MSIKLIQLPDLIQFEKQLQRNIFPETNIFGT